MTQKEFAAMGVKARMEKLTPEQRKAIGLNAINKRWERYRASKAQDARHSSKTLPT